MRGYPVYRHEVDELFLYYNSSQGGALVIGPLQSQGLLKVQRIPGAEMTSDVDYSMSDLFAFSTWKQWDPVQRRFIENMRFSQWRLVCVDETFGFCLSGHLYPNNLLSVNPGRVLMPWPKANYQFEEVVFGQLYFRLFDDVYHNLRPVYEMMYEGGNGTAPSHAVRRYLYHSDGKWRVSAEIGSLNATDGMFLELEGNAMRVEYENETEWQWLDFTSSRSLTATRRKAFGGLRCSRQLPDAMNCQVEGVVSCDNGGTCHTDANGVSSCLCPTGYRGIQCKHPMKKCVTSFLAPPQAWSVSQAPHYEGSITTVFCSSEDVQYSVCQNGSWQPTSRTVCSSPATLTVTTTTTTWLSVNQSDMIVYDSQDSITTIAIVIVVLVCVQLGCPFLCYCCAACGRSDNEYIDDEIPAEAELKLDTQKRKGSLLRTCSGFFYLCWWAWLVFIIVYFVRFADNALDGSTVLSAVAIMAFVCLGVLYCSVFFETFSSNEYKYLTELENEEVTAGEQITEMKAAKPTITFMAQCSRNETRTRTVQAFRHGYSDFSVCFYCTFSFITLMHLGIGSLGRSSRGKYPCF